LSLFSPVIDKGLSTEKFTKEKANCPEFVKILTTERNFMEKPYSGHNYVCKLVKRCSYYERYEIGSSS
jgi:hypothetical protein